MIRRASFRFWAVILLGSLLCTNARADRLVLTDGRDLPGKIMSQTGTSVTFASKENGKVVVRKYQLAQIRSIIPELNDKNNPFPKPDRDPDDPQNPKNKVIRTGPVTKTDRVIFLIDRSGSMALGSRLEKAVKLAEELMLKFEGETRLQVFAFDERAEPIQRD
ncbi:MAG: VWA domain-containing protein, partial [Planctomycetota bacterium]|nr:VWA domain-containing protein [Planctomycetota bacterium]